MPKPRSQSRNLSQQLGRRCSADLFPAFPEEVFFRRAREALLYDVDGHRYTDFYLAGGRLPFGHSPAFLRQDVRNQVSRNSLQGYPALPLFRFFANLERFPEIPNDCRFLPLRRPDALLLKLYEKEGLAVSLSPEEKNVIFREAKALCFERQFRFPEAAGRVSLIEGILDFSVLITREDDPLLAHLSGLQPDLPDSVALEKAATLFKHVLGEKAPYPVLKRHRKHFVSEMRSFLVESSPEIPRIRMNERLWRQALEAGFWLDPEGHVYFSAAHTDLQISKLCRFLKQHL